MGPNLSKLSALLELVRWMGRGLRGDGSSPLRLADLAATCAELEVPVEYVTAGLAVLRRVSAELGFDTGSLGGSLPAAAAYFEELEEVNATKLAEIAGLVAGLEPQPEPPLLLGDLASLLEIFGSLGAHPVRVVTVGLATAPSEEESVTRRLMTALPFEVSVAPLGRLRGLGGRYTRTDAAAGARLRVPTGELMVVLLAARLGDPAANPASPTWMQLAVALKAWRDTLDMEAVLDLARELDLEGRVHHGLAIVQAILPELDHTIPVKELKVPAVERRVAVPIAARRVVAFTLGEDT